MFRTRTHKQPSHNHKSRPFFSKGLQAREAAPFFSAQNSSTVATVQPKREVSDQQELEEVQTQEHDSDLESSQYSAGEAPLPPSEPNSQPTIQPKLTIAQPNDQYEQEADRVAEQVMQTPAPPIQRQIDDEEDEEARELIQPKQEGHISPLVQKQAELEEFEEETDDIVQTKPLSSQTLPLIQRKCASCAEEEKTDLGKIQPKLQIGQPNDRYEQEADRIADQVIRMPDVDSKEAEELVATKSESRTGVQLQREGQPNLSSPIAFNLQMECEECKISPPTKEEAEEASKEPEDEDQTTQVNPKAETSAAEVSNGSPSDFENSLSRAKRAGHPLPNTFRQTMEGKLGEDFSHVRIHMDSESTFMNRSIRAKAFTHENHIFFNESKYNPNTKNGQWLLAHELTHVIQQTGSRAIQPKIQRSAELKLGNWAHARIQKLLRSKDKKLITEAPIPGGTRDGKKINSVGFADLYKAEGQVVSGISAQEPAESKLLKEENAFYKYVNMRKDWLAKAKPKPKPKTIGPKIKSHKKDIWTFSPNFPSNFEIGEIKPLIPSDFPKSIAYHAAGIIQVGNYREGFMDFVKRVYQDKPKHQKQLPAQITGRPINLDEKNIPDAINYKKFEQEHRTVGKEAILKGKDRVWVYNKYKNKDGLLVYFLIPHQYTSKEFHTLLKKQLKQLDPILKRLRQKRPKMSKNLLSTKRDFSISPNKLTPVISQKRKPGIQSKREDPIKLGKKWEEDRKKWVRGEGTSVEKPKKFLKEQAKGVEKKAKADKKLGIEPADSKIKKQIKNVKKIRFWSSLRGRFLGALRFRFRKVFDKVQELFEKMKKKFKEHHKKSDELNKKKGIFDGWKKVATKTIIRLSVEILKQMLVEAFKGFVNCINGIIDAILEKFTSAVDQAKEDLIKEIEPVCCEIISFKKELEDEYEKHQKEIASFTETIEKIRKWREILDYVETAVRAGVQIVSCGLPPGLGCLWGLVAQIGIGAGLSLLSRTDYFKNEIAKPAARQLMDTIVGDSLHNFLIETLEKTPLKPLISEAKACRKRTDVIGSNRVVGGSKVIGGNLDKLDPNDPKIVKARREWEQDPEIQKQILQDLQTVFEKGKGQKVTQEDLQKLVELIQKSKKSPEEIKQMIEAARNPANGKLKLETASANVEKGEVPKAQPKKRNIDYEVATRSNKRLQKAFGWDPLKFHKKPGVKVDSEEFADAVYDMQEALKINPDGILGVNTIIAFYDTNKLKKDFLYKEAVKRRDEERSKKEKGKEGGGETTAPREAPSGTFITLNGPDYAIKEKFSLHRVPRAVDIILYKPAFRELVKKPENPGLVTLDIYVKKIHTYRIQNVSVQSVSLGELLATPTNIPFLKLTLTDGIQMTIGGEGLSLPWLWWRTD